MRTRPVALDFIVIFAVCLFAVVLFLLPFFARTEGETVTVVCKKKVNSSVVYEGPLREDKTLELENNGIKLTVVIKDGEAYIFESSCDDRVCVHSGRISSLGQSIICAPAGVIVNVSGGGFDDDISAG